MKFRVQPQAVCRQLLAQLDSHPHLTKREEAQVLSALEKCGVPTDRVLAALQRNTLQNLLGELG